jgi:arabinofuranosyltransferase
LATAIVIPFAMILVAHAWRFLPFLSDDALISLRYARRLLDGFGLTWTDGHPVEGYSNLLWVLAVAVPGRFGIDLITAARALGLICSVWILFSLAWWYTRSGTSRPDRLALVVALAFLAFAAPVAVWAIGGLEQPLYSALLAAAVPLAFRVIDRSESELRSTWGLSVLLGLVSVTRPDGLIFPAVTAVSILLAGLLRRQPAPVAHATLTLLWPVVLSAAQLAFRLLYYGEFVPNTALVKIAGTATHRVFGAEYVTSALWALWPFSFLGLAGLAVLVAVRATRARGFLLLGLAAVWTSYVIYIGGDIFPAYRHLTPLIVLFAFALAEGFALLFTAIGSRSLWSYALAALALVALVPYSRAQAADKWIGRATTERWEWQAKDLAVLLKTAFGAARPRLAVTAAGSLPYWSGLPALDMMGLSDYYLPRNRPANFGSGMVGHELGDGRYVLDQRPDIIIFDVGAAEPSWRTGDELKKLPEFSQWYVPVRVRVEPSGFDAVMFVDKDSRAIGIRGITGTISIPGFLFTGNSVIAGPDARGRLVARLGAGTVAALSLDADPTVAWGLDPSTPLPEGLAGDVKQDGGALVVTLRAAKPVEVDTIVLAGRPRS